MGCICLDSAAGGLQIPGWLRPATVLGTDFEACAELELPLVCSRHPCRRTCSIESSGRWPGQIVVPPIQCLQTLPIHGDRLAGLGRKLTCGCVDWDCVVHLLSHLGRRRVVGIWMELLGLQESENGVLPSCTVAGHHQLQFSYDGCVS